MSIPDCPANNPLSSPATGALSSSAKFNGSDTSSSPYCPGECDRRDSGDFRTNGDLDFNIPAGEEEADLVEILCSGFPEQMHENSSLVAQMALIMLRFRDNEVASAKERLGNYLAWRKDMFGNLDDHYLHSDPLLRKQLQSGFLHVFIDKAADKPALMYAEMKHHIPRTYSAAQTLKCWHFLIFSAMQQNMNILRSGFIVLQNLDGCGMGNSDSKIPEYISNAVQNVMPIRVIRVIFYKSPRMLKYLFKFVKFVFSRKIQDRMVVTNTQSSLTKKYGVNPELMPVGIGGTLVVPSFTADGGLESSPLLGGDVHV